MWPHLKFFLSQLQFLFFGQSTTYYYIKGDQASVTIPQNDPVFVVKFSDGGDPNDEFVLIRFEVKQYKGENTKSRYAQWSKSSGTAFKSKTEKNNENDVPITFTKISQGLYWITPSSKLSRGEYGFDYAQKRMFAFSIE